MKNLFFAIAMLAFFFTKAQNPIGASYQSIYDRFNTKFFTVEKFDQDDMPSIKGLLIKEIGAPYNTHVFYFKKATNKCIRYLISFSKDSECIAATSVLNGIYKYRVSNKNGESQWYNPANPTFKIILIENEDGVAGIGYFEEDMSKLD